MSGILAASGGAVPQPVFYDRSDDGEEIQSAEESGVENLDPLAEGEPLKAEPQAAPREDEIIVITKTNKLSKLCSKGREKVEPVWDWAVGRISDCNNALLFVHCVAGVTMPLFKASILIAKYMTIARGAVVANVPGWGVNAYRDAEDFVRTPWELKSLYLKAFPLIHGVENIGNVLDASATVFECLVQAGVAAAPAASMAMGYIGFAGVCLQTVTISALTWGLVETTLTMRKATKMLKEEEEGKTTVQDRYKKALEFLSNKTPDFKNERAAHFKDKFFGMLSPKQKEEAGKTPHDRYKNALDFLSKTPDFKTEKVAYFKDKFFGVLSPKQKEKVQGIINQGQEDFELHEGHNYKDGIGEAEKLLAMGRAFDAIKSRFKWKQFSYALLISSAAVAMIGVSILVIVPMFGGPGSVLILGWGLIGTAVLLGVLNYGTEIYAKRRLTNQLDGIYKTLIDVQKTPKWYKYRPKWLKKKSKGIESAAAA